MSPKTRKVFIPNKSGHNFSDAERFGELIYVTEGNVDRFNTSYMYRAFAEVFEGKSSKDDYLLVSSMNVLNCIAAACFARKHGTLNLLLFSRGEYVERELNIDALITMEQERAAWD